MDDIPGFIGKFRVDGVLGRGAMGTVYKAHDPDIDRVVALKLVRTDLLSGEDRAHYVARFQGEARIAGRCLHPNIVGIHDFAMHGDDPFLVLEYVHGRHLGKLLAETGPPGLAFVGQTMLSVLEALNCAHGFGVVHRDIKPANVLVAGDAVKVADFGISRAAAADLTMDSMLIGTPCYMSPEQCLGEPVDARSDLFSSGCLLYEMLSGRRAFSGDNYVVTMQKVLHEVPAALAGLRPGLCDGILHVVDRALAKDPRDRFPGAREMAEEVRAVFGGASGEVSMVEASSPPRTSRTDAFARMEGSTLSSIERRLASLVGPMARHHLRHALTEAATPEELSRALTPLVAEPERERLASDVLRIISSDASLAPAGHDVALGIPDEALRVAGNRYARALAQIMGPIAPILVRRALLQADTPAQLEVRLLSSIDAPEQKAQFQALLPSEGGSITSVAQRAVDDIKL